MTLPDFGRGLFATPDDLLYLQGLVQSPSVGPPMDREKLARCARTIARVLSRELDNTRDMPVPREDR